ncbi:hypothetical protein [Trebonia sp.]|uniref:hypothetical protein n=1 Tax=Trebonia sp. TaxID=2767075 RepID=UPI0026154998|nr:hypothetical protein [Trebonia sp.]
MSGITVTPRTVRHIAIATGRPYEQFRAEYEAAVPAFDRLEAIGVVNSGAGWAGIESLSRNTATNGLASFFTFDPSPVMKLNGSTRRGVTYLSGNIIEAEKGFRVDPACFLYLPLRVVIAEASDGTAVLGVDLPADLFDVFPAAELAEVASRFTRTLGQVLRQLRLPVPSEIAGAAGDESSR